MTLSRLLASLTLLIQLLSSSTATADFDNEPILEAINHGNFESVIAYFEKNVQAGLTPLQGHEDQGYIFYALFHLMIAQDSPKNNPKIDILVKQAIKMGGDPTKEVVFDGEQYPEDELPFDAVDFVLNQWISRIQTDDPKKDLYARSAQRMFDLWFANGGLSKDHQVIKVFDIDEGFRRVGLIHKVVMDSGDISIVDYFLRAGVGNSSLDDGRWNMAMIAAASGRLDVLKKIQLLCEPSQTASLFNYQCDIRFKPTVIHAAVVSARFVGGKRAFEIIEFLAKNGADPHQKSVFHTLVQEIDFWSERHPKHRYEYFVLKKLVVQKMARLESLFHGCIKSFSEANKVDDAEPT